MAATFAYTPVRSWIVASGLVHLSLIAFFVLGPKFQFHAEKPEWVEVTLLPAQPVAASRAEVFHPVRPNPTPKRRASASEPVASSPTAVAPVSGGTDAEKSTADSAATVDASAAAAQEVLSSYEMELASRLNALKHYPSSAKRMRQQGRVIVRFKLTRDGQVVSREIVEPCPHQSLNEAATSFLAQIKEFKPFPSNIAVNSWEFTVPIEYRL